MALIQYPVFVKGQTLTDDDLNELRDFLDRQDRSLGRLIGFGINCGLGGTINDKVLSIDLGLAIDQLGESIVLDDIVKRELPPPAATELAPDFLETAPGGYTPVLTVTAVELPAVRCTEAGCEGHAKQREVRTSITLYPGRLSDKVVDFGDEPLLGQEPLLVRKTGTVAGPFKGLRDAILARLGDRLNADAKAKLAALAIDNDLPAIQGFKAGFLNQVFFAALELLRCELLTTGGCGSTEGSVGVALGWAHQNGAGWTWDCTYRHDWRVSTGVALAILGGRCADPCDLYRDQINAMINAFEVPVVPAKEEPPSTHEPDICLIPNKKVTKQGIFDSTICGWVKLPPHELPQKWPPPYWSEKPDLGRPLDFLEANHIYGRPDSDPLELGGLDLLGAVGHRATDVRDSISKLTKDRGVDGDIRIIGVDGIKDVAGYEATLTPSFADTIFLTEDSLGKLIGAGAVPGSNVLRNAATDMPQVKAAAGRAEEAAASALEVAGTLNERVETFDQQLEGLGNFQEAILTWQSSVTTRIGGLTGEIDTKVTAAVSDLQLRVGGEVDQLIDAAAESVRTDQRALSAQVTEIGQEVAGLSGQIQSVAKEAERGNVRIDTVLSRATTPGRVPLRSVEFDTGIVSVLGSMRESITAAATPAQREKVRAALAAADEAFTRLQTASAAATIDLTAEKEAFGAVLESMTVAVDAAGAPAAAVARLRKDSAGVLGRMR